jgi:hypothetical protein
MSEPDSSPTPSPLQFERAELEEPQGQEARGVQCAFCQTSFLSTYFDINGQTACQICRANAEADFQTRPGLPGFLRALAAGFGAALAGGGIYYAVLALTDYEFSLISILVGFLVGNAVRWGARGKGGWVYQTLAIFLTYMAIVSTYIPIMLKSFSEEEESKKAAVSAPAQAGPQPAATRAGLRRRPAPRKRSRSAGRSWPSGPSSPSRQPFRSSPVSKTSSGSSSSASGFGKHGG